MIIKDAARQTGLPVKTLRYYEEIGLVEPGRADNGYRDYSDDDVHKLAFIARGRSLGFSIEDCRQLLSLYQDRDRSSSDVKALAKTHIDEINQKIDALESMRSTLTNLVKKCHGDDRPDCPIMDELAGP